MTTVEDGIRIMADEEACALFDRRAREQLDMSGEEFLRRWRAGEFAGRDEPGVIDLVMLLPLVESRDDRSNTATGSD